MALGPFAVPHAVKIITHEIEVIHISLHSFLIKTTKVPVARRQGDGDFPSGILAIEGLAQLRYQINIVGSVILEIEQFYKSMEEDGNHAANMDVASLDIISKSVRHLFVAALPAAKEIGPDVNLLTAGVDSLVAFSISNSLRSALGKHNVSEERKLAIASRFVYTDPTINALSKALYNLVHGEQDEWQCGDLCRFTKKERGQLSC